MDTIKLLSIMAALSCIFSFSMARNYASDKAYSQGQFSFVFIKDAWGKFLIQEVKEDFNNNMVRTAPVIASLDVEGGESAHESATRACAEQANFQINKEDLHLFATVFEKNYSAEGRHFLLYLFECKKSIDVLPSDPFSLCSRDEINEIIDEDNDVDRKALWNLYDEYKNDFVVAKAEFHSHEDPNKGPDMIIEEVMRK